MAMSNGLRSRASKLMNSSKPILSKPGEEVGVLRCRRGTEIIQPEEGNWEVVQLIPECTVIMTTNPVRQLGR